MVLCPRGPHSHTYVYTQSTSYTNKWINQSLNKLGDLDIFFPSFLLPQLFLLSAWSLSLNRKRGIELKSAFDISSSLKINKMLRLRQQDDFRPCFTLPRTHPHPTIPAPCPAPLLWLESGNPFAIMLSDLTQTVSGSLHTSPSVLVPSFPSLSPPFPFFSLLPSPFVFIPLAVCCRLCGEFAQITCHTGGYV